MIPDAEARTGPVQATEHDPRITRIGRIMRATAMDELPQLWNIFAGDMSFVGPRPLRPGEVEVRGDGQLVPLDAIPGYRTRHSIRPGLTGLTQVYASRDISRTSKFRLDQVYVTSKELLARREVDRCSRSGSRARARGKSATAASLNSPLIMLALMDRPIDVLIVGGGPGGLFMAARLAERGVRTLVCEEHARVGDPVHCTGVLSADSFTRFDLPGRRDAQPADVGPLPVARRHTGRLLHTGAPRHGDRSAGFRSRARGSRDRRRRGDPRSARA